MIDEASFNAKADTILPIMEAHVNDPANEATRAHLLHFGWKNPLTTETIKYYKDRYAKLYSTLTTQQQEHLLARYFAGALARYPLGITGVDQSWGGKFIELSFVQPAPGISASRALRRIYYRTMPSSITSNHCPPWRSKGYLKINGDIKAQIVSFNHLDGFTFNPNTVTLSNGETTTSIQADYIVV